jgi:hypothetical protein
LWEEVAVNLIGPWSITIEGMGTIHAHALTMIDTTSTLLEIKRIENKTSSHITMLFENKWLSCYPRPLRVILHGPGSEFVGPEFQA